MLSEKSGAKITFFGESTKQITKFEQERLTISHKNHGLYKRK